ncbi:hypothetical protein ACIO87_36200 [Streptomyces sp. NPDC087218]|uniref:hypothetical protein n=1 Tax=Streptomyces sp. NPDC087218 TaxID=3365769 RepID=UPI00380C0551
MPAQHPGERRRFRADASARGTAGELVLFTYDRIPADSVELDGGLRVFDPLRAREPEEPHRPGPPGGPRRAARDAGTRM